jgi:hypothetical protein
MLKSVRSRLRSLFAPATLEFVSNTTNERPSNEGKRYGTSQILSAQAMLGVLLVGACSSDLLNPTRLDGDIGHSLPNPGYYVGSIDPRAISAGTFATAWSNAAQHANDPSPSAEAKILLMRGI